MWCNTKERKVLHDWIFDKDDTQVNIQDQIPKYDQSVPGTW